MTQKNINSENSSTLNHSTIIICNYVQHIHIATFANIDFNDNLQRKFSLKYINSYCFWNLQYKYTGTRLYKI